jgi:hypothetical protein
MGKLKDTKKLVKAIKAKPIEMVYEKEDLVHLFNIYIHGETIESKVELIKFVGMSVANSKHPELLSNFLKQHKKESNKEVIKELNEKINNL